MYTRFPHKSRTSRHSKGLHAADQTKEEDVLAMHVSAISMSNFSSGHRNRPTNRQSPSAVLFSHSGHEIFAKAGRARRAGAKKRLFRVSSNGLKQAGDTTIANFVTRDIEYKKPLSEAQRGVLPKEGVEPSPCCQDGILNPARLPIPPLRRFVSSANCCRLRPRQQYNRYLLCRQREMTCSENFSAPSCVCNAARFISLPGPVRPRTAGPICSRRRP